MVYDVSDSIDQASLKNLLDELIDNITAIATKLDADTGVADTDYTGEITITK